MLNEANTNEVEVTEAPETVETEATAKDPKAIIADAMRFLQAYERELVKEQGLEKEIQDLTDELRAFADGTKEETDDRDVLLVAGIRKRRIKSAENPKSEVHKAQAIEALEQSRDALADILEKLNG